MADANGYAPLARGGTDTDLPEQEEPREEDEKLVITDQDFLRICKAERINSIGMYYGDEIMRQRDTALRYYKGDMSMAPEHGGIPALPNRSSAISTDVADAILTAMPDLVEIFIGGEEIGSFQAVSGEDVEAAKQETAVVNHVILQKNDGFGLIYDGIHDALLNKTGVYMAWVEEYDSEEEEILERVTPVELQAIPEDQIVSVEPSGLDDLTGMQVFQVEVKRSTKDVKICIESVEPENFACARDTKGSLRTATYCVMRSMPRAQDLIADGFDPEKVALLNTYTPTAQQEIDRARDTAGEHDRVTSISDATLNMRQVVVHRHVLRVDADGDGKPEVWLIDTDDKEGLILQKKRLNQVCFAAGSPYRVPHRFYGQSLADRLLEIQKIKTALTRAALDSRYFSLNRRYEVNMDRANEHTLNDLLNNTPGYPVRSKGEAIKPLFDKGFEAGDLDALEYFSTVSEHRTGVVRNAQGLNPDTLHETKGGAEMLMNAAQKRLRFIARTLAETMFKDLYVLVHSLLRQHSVKPMPVPISKQWIVVDPTQWAQRDHFSIEMGGGSREQDVMMLTNIGNMMEKVIAGQASGAINPPVVTAENVYNWGNDLTERSGKRDGDRYWTDPKVTGAQQQPQEDPEVAKAKAELAMQQQQMQFDAQAQAVKLANDKQAAEDKAALDRWVAEQEQRLAREKAAFEAELAERNAQREAELAVFQAKLQADTAKHTAQVKAEADAKIKKNRPGGSLAE